MVGVPVGDAPPVGVRGVAGWWVAGRAGKAGRNPVMDDVGSRMARSTSETAEQGRAAGAEAVEGRRPAKGNAASKTRAGLSAGEGVTSDLDRVRRVAQKDRDARFTALLHHVTLIVCGRRTGR